MIAAWRTADQMRALLDRERARVDRSGRTFCLLTFDSASHAALDVPAFDAIFTRRLRCTDEYGWMGESTVGVLLPETDPSGAECLAGAIMAEYPVDRSPLRRELFCYPSEAAGRCVTLHSARRSTRVRALEPLFVVPVHPWKRALDVAGAAFGLIVTAPLLACSAALIRLTSPGPVLFRQQRAGRGGRPFTLLKLRTMHCGAERRRPSTGGACTGPTRKDPNDPRVTSIGRLLRRWSIDEIPQFWNVLRGDMSLVGPRPLPLDESDACAPWQRRRLDLTPGMTCIWQVSGRTTVSFVEWARMDLRYGRRRSWQTDVVLILRTIPAVLSGRGAA